LTAWIFAVPFRCRNRRTGFAIPFPASARFILRQNRLRWHGGNRSFARDTLALPASAEEQDGIEAMHNSYFEGELSMAKTLDERIAETKVKISQYENQVKRLAQRQKEAERKARTRRLIERGAIWEAFLPEPESLSNEQVEEILMTWRTGQNTR
jgi:hypothetical protein